MDHETPVLRIRSEADLNVGLSALCAADPRLATVAKHAGPLPLRLRDPGYQGLAAIVVSQMVSRASAEAIWKRLEAATGGVTPQACLTLDDAAARAIGLSRAKERALQAVASAVLDDGLDLEGLCTLAAEDATAHLTQIAGIGQWTADVYLLFCAGHADIFPDRDVALQSAVGHAFARAVRPSARELSVEAQAWAPWRGVAARLFWAYYARQMRRSALPVD